MSHKGPDFLCVGMQKTGTDWFYDAFCLLDDFRMLPIKEFHHFDAIYNPGERNAADSHKSRLLGKVEKDRKNLLQKRDAEALNGALTNYFDNDRSHESYLSLFDLKGSKLSGDVTPAYSGLSEIAIQDIQLLLPDIKIILIVRHPIDRIWSHFNMYLRNEVKKKGVFRKNPAAKAAINELASLQTLGAFLSRPAVQVRSYPSKTYQRWSRFEDHLLVLDFDEFAKNSNEALAKTCEFLTGQPYDLPDGFQVINKKRGSLKAKMTGDHKDFLSEYFKDEVESCKKLLPEIAGKW